MELKKMECHLRRPLKMSFEGEGNNIGEKTASDQWIFRKLAIIREIPILKVKRSEGSNVRGTRPVTVFFEKYQVLVKQIKWSFWQEFSKC